jgi:predicted double-glycine peptidase
MLLACFVVVQGCAGGEGSMLEQRHGANGIGLSTFMANIDGDVPVRSFRELRFLTTIRQQFDYSCGSAALATLLTHHYGMPTREDEILRDMITHGDAEVIRQQGFSLLDMQRYLERRGLRSNGFRLPLTRYAELRVPAIALINNEGYRHFVVVRGIDDDRVLIADPNLGGRTLTRAEFEAIWNGVMFFVTDRVEEARATFGRPSDWAARPRAPIQDRVNEMDGMRVVFGFRDTRFF